MGLFAALFAAVGIVATTGNGPGVVLVFAAIALFVAVLLALAAWGVAHSIRRDLAARRLDEAISEVLARNPQPCGCGHDHDASEMHVRAACDHDGTGVDCEHNCDTCELAALRADT